MENDLENDERNELVKKEYTFDKNNILSEKEGDIISKIIIGNITQNFRFNHFLI